MKLNTNIKVVLKQAEFNSFITHKINKYKKYYEQKIKSITNFYNYLNIYNAILEIRQGSEFYKLNSIKRYYILYKYSTFLERFITKTKDIFGYIIKKHKYAPLKLHLNY